METTQTTGQAKVALTRGDTVPESEKEVLAKVSKSVNKNNNKKYRPVFQKGQEVFLTAFLKEEKGTFYVCKGVVEEIPAPDTRQVYKVKVTAIADRPVGGDPVVKQARLLGLVCTKRPRELHSSLPAWMEPDVWIDKDPRDTKHSGGNRRGHGKNKRKRQASKKKVQARGHSPSSSEKA